MSPGGSIRLGFWFIRSNVPPPEQGHRKGRTPIDIETRASDPREALHQWADSHGYAIAWGDVALVGEVQEQIKRRHTNGDLDEHFFTEAVAGILRPLAETATGTVICVAIPRPAHRVTFETEGGVFTAIAPPTYMEYGRVMDAAQHQIEAIVQPAHVVSLAWKPLKSLAVRLGMAKYGRNNLTYTSQTGCMHELAAFLIDVRIEPWPGLQDLETLMPQCDSCDACRRACPTGAIGADRYLIHGDRCVTFLNEYPGDWPEWLSDNAHSAIIGCMRCIGACPANRGKLRIDAFPQPFTRTETEAILDGRTAGNEAIWQSIAARLTALDCDSWLDPLTRNLRALVGASNR